LDWNEALAMLKQPRRMDEGTLDHRFAVATAQANTLRSLKRFSKLFMAHLCAPRVPARVHFARAGAAITCVQVRRRISRDHRQHRTSHVVQDLDGHRSLQATAKPSASE
jgi:hypothetical protein